MVLFGIQYFQYSSQVIPMAFVTLFGGSHVTPLSLGMVPHEANLPPTKKAKNTSSWIS